MKRSKLFGTVSTFTYYANLCLAGILSYLSSGYVVEDTLPRFVLTSLLMFPLAIDIVYAKKYSDLLMKELKEAEETTNE